MMDVGELQIWVEDYPDRPRLKCRYCWWSRGKLRCGFYGKYTSQACDKALERLWPERYGRTKAL